MPLTIEVLRGNFEKPHIMRAMHEKYGRVVRTAPNRLAFADADAWRGMVALISPVLDQIRPEVLTVSRNKISMGTKRVSWQMRKTWVTSPLHHQERSGASRPRLEKTMRGIESSLHLRSALRHWKNNSRSSINMSIS